MFGYGRRSKEKLEQCHPDIQKVWNVIIKFFDNSVLEGIRRKDVQNNYAAQGRSKVYWPFGKHNVKDERTQQSYAIDSAPYPIKWPELEVLEEDEHTITLTRKSLNNYVKTKARFYYMGGIVKAVSKMLGIELRWGGDWDGDYDFTDQTFDDLNHWEKKEKRPWDK